jgi:hypothetical protein
LSDPTAIVQLPSDRKYGVRNLARLSPLGIFAIVVGISSGHIVTAVVVAGAIVTVTSLTLRALQILQWRRAVPASANTWEFPASVLGVPGALAVTPDEIAWQPRGPRTAARIMARWDDLPSLEIQSVPTVVPLCRIRLSTDSDREPQDILVSARCTVVATALMRRFEPLGPVISGHSRSHRRRPVVASEFGYRSGWSISTCRGSSV